MMVSPFWRSATVYNVALLILLSSEETKGFSSWKPLTGTIKIGNTATRIKYSNSNLPTLSSRVFAKNNDIDKARYDVALSATPLAEFEKTLENTTLPLNTTTNDNIALMTEDNVEFVDALQLMSQSTAETALLPEEESETLQSKLLSADVIGPVLSVVGVGLFLFLNLLNSETIETGFTEMDFSHKLEVLSKISWIPRRLDEAELVVSLVMAFSAFAQALTGFGFAVVAVGMMSSMPWLLHSELYEVITPVAATLGALVGSILLIPFAFATPTEEEPGLEWDEILPLLIPCTLLTPVGIALNSAIDPSVGTRVLAGLILAFVAYKLYPIIQEKFKGDADDDAAEIDDGPPEFLTSTPAAIVFGAAAGVFGGAFDVQGPPLCVYGDAKGWSPAKFRNIVLTVVAVNSASVVALDAFQGKLGDFYYPYFCITSLPGVLIGVVAGQYASARIDPVLFKNIVLTMCLLLGIQLLTIS